MNILDENIPANQRQLLEHWGVRVQQIGFNIGRRGMHDDEVIPLLLEQRRPTFFTRDEDFYDRELCHPRSDSRIERRNFNLASSCKSAIPRMEQTLLMVSRPQPPTTMS